MRVYLKSIESMEDAIRTLYMSKRTWTPELDNHIRDMVSACTDRYGIPIKSGSSELNKEFDETVGKVIKYGKRHITMLRFLDFTVVVEGLHRGATDDFDAHAKRLENRIIRTSTRLSTYSADEMSDWYKDKIIPTDMALARMGIVLPESISLDGKEYVKSENGYILDEFKNDRDVKRGLYMLSLPMNFTFKVNATEFAHIYKERGSKDGGAHGAAAPELQEMIESLADQIENCYPQLNRDLWLEIVN